jgi:DNA-binding NarL/FixJ family response regulator
VRDLLGQTLARIAQGTADEAIRVRWLTGPVGRLLVELVGPMDESAAAFPAAPEAPGRGAQSSLDQAERRLLQLLTEGRTNAEIATDLDLTQDEVAQRLARLFASLGTASRADATSLAFRGLAAVGSR